MGEVYPGPYCEALKLNCGDIDSRNILEQSITLKNGAVLELRDYLNSDVCSVLRILCSNLKEINPNVLRTKIVRLVETKKKLQRKKKVRGFKNLQDLLDAEFHITPKLKDPEHLSDSEVGDLVARYETLFSEENVEVEDTEERIDTLISAENTDEKSSNAASELGLEPKSSENLSDNVSQVSEGDAEKTNNLLQIEILKNTKILRRVLDDISRAESKLADLLKRKGHYSIKNVNKRDELHRKNHQILRDNRRVIKKQVAEISKLSRKLSLQKAQTKRLQSENKYLNELNNNKKKRTSVLSEEIKKKRVAQKAASHYRVKFRKLMETNSKSIQGRDVRLKEED